MICRVLKSNKCEITQYFSDNHKGIDIVGAGYTLDYVVAQDDGKVVFCQDGFCNMKGSKGMQSYGNYVKIEHKNGYATLYAHMKKGLPVKIGDNIAKGQVIGYMSDSGNAYGAHLHFEVWKEGKRINPIKYINSEDINDKKETYIVKPNDTLSKIATKYNTTWQKLAFYNNITNPDFILVGQKILIPSNSDKIFYIVKTGDTLSSIANSYNTTWQKIYNDNIAIIGKNPNLIYPGQKLEINR